MFARIKNLFKKKEQRFWNPLMDGDLRNEPCICNSGKKIKNCHGAKYALNINELKEIQNYANSAIGALK